jgi:CTP:molybdopterin cytidylyltransferase MocA
VGFSSGVLLAAGASRRFGSTKLLHPFRGEPMVLAQIRAFLGAGLDEVVVVAGAAAREIASAVAPWSVRVVENRGWDAGMFSSVRCGLAALDPLCEVCLLSPADLPFLTSGSVRRVLEGALSDGGVVVPTSGGRRGHPLALPATVVREVLSWPASSRLDLALDGRFPVRHLEGFPAHVLHDVDTPDQLAAPPGEAP